MTNIYHIRYKRLLTVNMNGQSFVVHAKTTSVNCICIKSFSKLHESVCVIFQPFLGSGEASNRISGRLKLFVVHAKTTSVNCICIKSFSKLHESVCVIFQPFLGSGEASNRISGRLKLGSQTLATLDGHWDQEIFIKDKSTGVCKLTVI